MLTKEERAIIAQGRALKARESKAKKAKRPKSPKADRGRVRDNGYLAFLRRQHCVIWLAGNLGECDGPIQACHIRTPKPGEPPTGLQRKPDDNRATAMCAKHHLEQHQGNEMAFWRRYRLDPFRIAAQLYAQYQGAKP